MLKININNETSELVSVILGSANSNGPTPSIKDCYDPKSIEHIIIDGNIPRCNLSLVYKICLKYNSSIIGAIMIALTIIYSCSLMLPVLNNETTFCSTASVIKKLLNSETIYINGHINKI